MKKGKPNDMHLRETHIKYKEQEVKSKRMETGELCKY